MDCILIVGFFILIYVNRIVYQESSYEQVKSMVEGLSSEAQKILYDKLRADLIKMPVAASIKF